MASYTAFELYLINKFEEYYKFILKNNSEIFIRNSIKRLPRRSLEEIKKLYFDLLDIHLPSFDIEFFITGKGTFQPKTSWDAIILLSRARNEIAHQGESESYKITTLVDSWYPLDFCRRWVDLFDINFDYLIYEGRETSLIKEYKERVSKKSGT